MHEAQRDLLYRKINRLTTALVACVAVIVLLFTIVLILVNGRIEQTRRQIAELSEALTALAERPPSVDLTSQPADTQTAAFTDEVAALVRALDPVNGDDPDAATLADFERHLVRLDHLADRMPHVDPEEATTVAELADRLGDAQRTLRWARRALTSSTNGKAPRARLLAAGALHALEKNDDALAEVIHVVRSEAAPPRAHLLHAEILDTLDRPGEAVRAYTKAQESAETAVMATAALARRLLDRDELDAAGLALRHPHVAGDTSPTLLAMRGELAGRQHHYAEAVELLTRATADGSFTLPARLWLGRAQLETGRHEAAGRTFASLASDEPDRPEGWYWQGIVALRELDPERAVPLLQQSIAVDASFVPAFEDLGVALANQQRVDDAVAILSEAVRLKATSGRAHFLLAVCHAKRDHRAAAITALKRAVALDRKYLELAKAVPIFEPLPVEALTQ